MPPSFVAPADAWVTVIVWLPTRERVVGRERREAERLPAGREEDRGVGGDRRRCCW